jgi:predicted metal-binding protein
MITYLRHSKKVLFLIFTGGNKMNILLEAAASAGVHVHQWAQLPAASLTFSSALLDYCKTNVCGYYNKSWVCPPACEPQEEQQKKILSYSNFFIFSTKFDLEDPLDFEGMVEGMGRHNLLTMELRNRLGNSFVFYGAGVCPYCKDENGKERCSFPDPCQFPDKKMGSMEAAGINVGAVSKAANITYNNGPNTTTYFSMVLYCSAG